VTIHAIVFEDNNGAYLLVMTLLHRPHQVLPCEILYHHIWDSHNQGLFEILPILTKYQHGGYMMKGMVHVPFKHNHFFGAVVVEQPSMMNDQ
jgi:hypothetical protein